MKTSIQPILATLLLAPLAALYADQLKPVASSLALSAPQLLSPQNHMQMTDMASFFHWSAVPGCSRYEIQIANDAAFTKLFRAYKTKDVTFHEQRYFPKDMLPAGDYAWRVRAISDQREGPWSTINQVRVNCIHSIAPTMVQAISPEQPLFLMRNMHWNPVAADKNLQAIIPPELMQTIVADDFGIWKGTEDALARARKYEALGVNFTVFANRGRLSLSLLEYIFQHYPHCLGAAEGEHFWSWGWEKGPEGNISEWDYVPRAWALCAKYGRYYFIGDGETGNYKWTLISQHFCEELQRYHKTIVPMFKSTIGHVALHSIGAVEGLMAAGWVDNCGFWADEFIWGECGFGQLGEISVKKEGSDRQCPYSYDMQMWLMGIVSGTTVFQLESAHQWTAEGKGAANYQRYYLPFVTAVVKHGLIPARQAFLESLKLAVACSLDQAKLKHGNKYDGAFGFLNELYALRNTPFQEIIPDNSRYGIIALLPPASLCLNKKTRVLPQEQLLTPGRAAELFNRAYPERFQGEAFVWTCDDTLIITNCRENEESQQAFAMQLDRGPVTRLSGTVAIHDYIIGKVAKDGQSLWFQANFGLDTQKTQKTPNPERILKLKFACPQQPTVNVTPASAKVQGSWDAVARCYALSISLKDGPAECVICR